MMRPSRLVVVAIAILSAFGCAQDAKKSQTPPLAMYQPKPATDVIKASYAAADALIAQARSSLAEDSPIIVATIVNLNDLEQSSPLGRLVAEQLAARIAQSGYRVIEVKLRNNIYMKRNEGELLLTRELRDIARQHKARAVLAGTYTDSARRVFVNLKLVDLETVFVAGATDYTLEKDEVVRSLLKPGP